MKGPSHPDDLDRAPYACPVDRPVAVLGFGALLLGACTQPRPTAFVAAAPPASPTFVLDRATLRKAGATDQLITKLETGRFRYFRMLAEPFEARTCEAFTDLAPQLPTTWVQGDAHLEQFVVTKATYGLEDFDHAGFGPAVVDLVRYAASLHVACRTFTWTCDPDAAVEKFLTAYRATLFEEPRSIEPTIVPRIRGRAPSRRSDWLTWINTLMMPVPSATDASVRANWKSFAELMHRVHPEWPALFTHVVRIGALTMGIGSALERKMLVRIEGPSASPDDDIVIEARAGQVPYSVSCVWRGSYGESMVLMFIAVLGRRMPEVHGLAEMLGSKRRFWVQSWDPGYVELELADIANQTELEELAVDAARQLAGPLWNRFPERLRRYEQYAQAQAFDVTRARVVKLAKQLATESNAAWERFGKP